jgi:hypothetical protein
MKNDTHFLTHFPTEQLLKFLSPFILAVLLPSAEYVIIAAFFVLSDTLTGVLAAKKKGERFNSLRLFDTVPKLIAYGTAILIAAVIQWKFMPEFPCIKGITLFVVYIELKSIDENITAITGQSMFKKIIQLINPKRDKP